MVTPSPYGNRLNSLWCSCQIISRIAKVIANTGSPRITCISSSNELGTSRETTRSVMAKPNTASLNASMRVTSDEASAMGRDSSAYEPGRSGRALSTSNSQPPTSKELPIPNSQRAVAFPRGWKLGVGRSLVVGNWKLGVGPARRPSALRALELLHERDERVDAVLGEGV